MVKSRFLTVPSVEKHGGESLLTYAADGEKMGATVSRETITVIVSGNNAVLCQSGMVNYRQDGDRSFVKIAASLLDFLFLYPILRTE